MKKIFTVIICFLAITSTQAQLPVIEVIKQASVKVIKAVDLMVQRWQNETLWLQNAQQELQNVLEKTKLQEIGDWVERQRAIYADYFDELSRVKSYIAEFHEVRSIITMQARMVDQYRQAITLFRGDTYFSAAEITYMEEVYSGILEQSVRNMEHMQIVVKAYTTSMSDAERLVVIHGVSKDVQKSYNDLQAFTRQNQVMRLQRAKTIDEVNQVKKMYGIE
jgi:hypothetical protein